MLRRIEVTLPPARTDEILRAISDIDGVLGLRVQKGISIQPPGDLIAVESLGSAHLELMSVLERREVARDESSTITVSEVRAAIDPTTRKVFGGESSRSSWEQLHTTLAKQSNLTGYMLTMMFLAGIIGAVGLVSGAVHVVLAAMLIAPGFEPVVRITFGWIAGTRGWKSGAAALFGGYAALLTGAVVSGAVLASTGEELLSGTGAYARVDALVAFWTAVGTPVVLVGLAAGAVGAVLVATDRSVLVTGVMAALAITPSAVVLGVALVEGDFTVAVLALRRWTVDVTLVLIGSSVFWAYYRLRVQARRSML